MEKKWIKKVNDVDTFVELNETEVKALSTEERAIYYKDALEGTMKGMVELKTQMANLDNDTAKAKNLAEQLKGYEQMFETLKGTQINQGEIIAAMKAAGVNAKEETFAGVMKATWDAATGGGKLEAALSTKADLHLSINKAEQTYGDIDAGSDFAQMRAGVIDKPVRRPRFRTLFPTTPVSTEYYKYVQQDTVTRDAKNVAKCAPVTSTTKETLKVYSIQTKMVKDMIDFCRTFVSDYPFMMSRIDRLINESLSLKIDSQLLYGNGIGENLFSIDYYASEFSATNVDAPIGATIQAANMVDLILAMQTQIMELGQQNGFDPNTVIVNKLDWFKNVESLKDLDNNYLDARVSVVNGVPYIGGMMVVWSPIVVSNTLYVFDSTKGEIIDRQTVELDIAFQNGTNWESEIATLKGYERLNLLVPSEVQNAFMKCTDVTTAIDAITKV